MQRRTFLIASATSLAGLAATLAGCGPRTAGATGGAAHVPTTAEPSAPLTTQPPPSTMPPTQPPPSTPAPSTAPPASPIVKPAITAVAPGPPTVLNALPGAGSNVALTIDDGLNPDVIAGYLDFAERNGVRLTFFVNGANPGWSTHAERIGRLVDIGQVQIGNHTWSHPDLTKLSEGAIADQLGRNDEFIQQTWGVTSRPYVRPPFGYRNATTDRICANLGYTKIAMWYGSFGDSTPIAPDALLTMAQTWLLPQHIVIGHANVPTVLDLYPQILDLLTQRGLTTVTLRDAFGD